MSNLEFHPEKAIGEGLLRLDKQELLQFVSQLCLYLKAQVGARAYHGGIFPENICRDENGAFAVGPAKMEKWTGQELEFVAPEMYWHGDASPAADVYSLALLVIYGLNEGKLPYDTATSSGKLARMSGKPLPMPKSAGKRLGEVLEKATAFQAQDRYQSPEELQIMLESCMDNKYLGGSSGAEAVFKKEANDLSEIERMMVDIIEKGSEPEESGEEESPVLPEGLSVEEQAGLEKPEPVPQEKEDINAMVEEFFGLSGEEQTPAPDLQDDGEEVRVYEPSKEKKERQPIPILTVEKYPELEPVVLKQQPRVERAKPVKEEQPAQPEPPKDEKKVRRRRARRAIASVLIVCLLLVAGALGLNLWWNRDRRPTQINPTPDPGSLLAPQPTVQPTLQPTEPSEILSIPTEAPQQPRYKVVKSDLSWTLAREACLEQEGHLATISGPEELAEITKLAEELGLTRIWVGCRWVNNELLWENGEQNEYFVWAANEPSSWDYYDNVPENYIMIFREGDRWLFNDCRDDPAGDYPEFYSGVMGYAIEFER